MSRPRVVANTRPAITVLEQRLDGWTGLRWNDLVLIGSDPTGREWSIGELAASARGRVGSAVLLGPTGAVLRTWVFKEPRGIPVERARVQVSLVAGLLGAQFAEVPWVELAPSSRDVAYGELVDRIESERCRALGVPRRALG